MSSSRPYALVVDDDPWLNDHFVGIIKSVGMEAKGVGDALAAIDQVDKRRPDVIVLDLFLPGPNGVVFIHELQSHADLANTPIIICSNSASEVGIKELAPYGVVELLDKMTITPSELKRIVKRVVAQ